MIKYITAFALYLGIASVSAFAQETAGGETETGQISIVSGLNQPIVLRGFNVEVDYWAKKWVFDYSHGVGLHIDGESLGHYENQKIDFKISHSFGFGVGYRFTKAFNVRLEPKVHVYETYYEGDRQKHSNSIANFTTYTMGIGAYYRWLPFEHNTGALKGITIVPSLRYWHKVDSTLKGDKFDYFNEKTGRGEHFDAPNIGLANSPFLMNVSIGNTF